MWPRYPILREALNRYPEKGCQSSLESSLYSQVALGCPNLIDSKPLLEPSSTPIRACEL